MGALTAVTLATLAYSAYNKKRGKERGKRAGDQADKAADIAAASSPEALAKRAKKRGVSERSRAQGGFGTQKTLLTGGTGLGSSNATGQKSLLGG